MVFKPPPWVPKLPEVPDDISVADFIFSDRYGRAPLSESKDPYTCGITGKSITAQEQRDRIDVIARGLAKEFGWKVNGSSEYDKVVCIFALNTIDVMSLTWGIHRINGVSSPANAAYSADEVRHQLSDSGAKYLFTVAPLLETAVEGAKRAGLSKDKIYLLPMPGEKTPPAGFRTLADIIKQGQSAPAVEPLGWSKGQGARQTAFLCYSSGTSGLPKGVMISHRNVIANTIQITLYDQEARKKKGGPNYKDVGLGLLPQSHIYGLIVICHVSTYRGDQVIVLPKFEMQPYLNCIARFKINTLYIVPPIIIAMVKNNNILQKYDLSSVKEIFTGAAPLGEETAKELSKQYPSWAIRQGYGLTETCTVVCSTSPADIVFGSSGSLITGMEAKVMSAEGNEITGYDQPGELLVKSPSVVLGYLKNDKASQETFVDMPEGRFMRTGDEVVVRKSARTGDEHIWVVDRIKELIKVKGLQVAPAELEACLLDHPAVADCAVIPIPDEKAGEVPKAYVVKSSTLSIEESEKSIALSIKKFVQKEKARHKWLAGGVEFVDVIPKSPSGKILRRLLRDKEKAKRVKAGSKL